jgi:hypothetical protein
MLVAGGKEGYEKYKAALQSSVTRRIPRPLQEYIPRLDSLQTSVKWLNQPGVAAGFSPAQMQQIKALEGQLTALQGRLQQAGEIKDFLREREQYLQDQLKRLNVDKQLKQMNVGIYNFQQRLSTYKDAWDHPEKMEQVILGLANHLPGFQGFMQKNSYLGLLFPMPQNYGTPQALAGVPSSADVGKMIAEKIGAVGTNIDPGQYLQQQVQAGQDHLSGLKAKVSRAGGGNSDMEVPRFTPNSQKVKPFLKRLEFGVNLQSQQGTAWLPVTTDIGMTAGYRWSDGVTMGLRAAYKMGWGSGFNHISISNQGMGMGGYIDIKARRSIWVTGAYEYNYMQEFAKWSDIKNLNVWQKSALLGLTKKYKVGSRTGNLQLLYDFMAAYERPRGTPLKFRVGYTF